jgi:hypothetical protein
MNVTVTHEATPARHRRPGLPDWTVPVAGGLALVLIGVSVLLMISIGISGIAPDPVVPHVGAGRFPLRLHPGLHRSPLLASRVVWAGFIIGAIGAASGLYAVGRGWRISPRALLIGSFAVCLVMAVIPMAGGYDPLIYAAYGRLSDLGHSPYVHTPGDLLRMHDPVGRHVPLFWRETVMVYGPGALLVFWVCAKIGGASMALIVALLKIVEVAAFLGVAVLLDRRWRDDPAARLRALFLWSLNPVLLWNLVLAAHIDCLAAFLLVAAICLFGRNDYLSGFLAGAACTLKLPCGAVALGLVLTCRNPRRMAAIIAGIVTALGFAYLPLGSQALGPSLAKTGDESGIDPWRALLRLIGAIPDNGNPSKSVLYALTATGLMIMAATLLRLWGWSTPSSTGMAIYTAWLITSPVQHPWYAGPIFALLCLTADRRLDLPILAWTTLTSFAYLYVPNLKGFIVTKVDGILIPLCTVLFMIALIVAAVRKPLTTRSPGVLQPASESR